MEITRRNLVGTVAVGAAALAAGGLGTREALATKELSSSEAAAGAGAFVEADMSITDEEALAWLREEPECKDIVLEDGTVVPAKYVRLRLRIDRAGGGVGGTPRDGSWKWLLENLTEEDVDNLLLMPVLEWFQAGDLDLDVHTEEEWRQICEELSLQGYLMRVRRAGIPHFHQLAFVHGLFEFSVLKHRDEDDNVQNITDVFALTGSDYSLWTGDTPVYHPLPVSADLVTDAHVLPYDDWKAIIARNTRFAVAPCQCRHAKISLGALSEDCTHPVETCMAFGEMADYYIENGIGREIDAEEADAILQRSVDAGMVIESEFTKASEVICSVPQRLLLPAGHRARGRRKPAGHGKHLQLRAEPRQGGLHPVRGLPRPLPHALDHLRGGRVPRDGQRLRQVRPVRPGVPRQRPQPL